MEKVDGSKGRKPTIEWVGVRPAPTAVGKIIRKFSKQYNINMTQLETALEQANKNHPGGWETKNRMNDTEGKAPLVHNYIYRSWPNISLDATLDIVCEAFETQLAKQHKKDKVKNICKRLKEEIRAVYNDQADKDGVRSAATFGLQYFFEKYDSEYALFISKYLEAFSSLTKRDIAFWDSLSKWDVKKRKEVCGNWQKQKIDYQTIISPAFQQWTILRNKNYSDNARKQRVGIPKPSKKFLAQIQKLSDDETKSVEYVLKRLKKRAATEEKKKFPLALPEEIDLLILFKYFLSDDQQDKVLKKLRLEKNGG